MFSLTVVCLLVAGALAEPEPRVSRSRSAFEEVLTSMSTRLKSQLSATELEDLKSATPFTWSAGSHTLSPGVYILKSPNFPFLYPNNYDRTWTIVGDEGQDIRIDCGYKIQYSSSCSNDYLQINGAVRCGIGHYGTDSDELEIRFVTNRFFRSLGFVCGIVVPPAATTTEDPAP
ncbi:uncharacterized protein LOC122371557 [Amphibalanus amphitrite]|uniref:uncharacterized protein LOC122371557 n=1 Tax=Amphibalanus amphitrite TaxID=1232801 RepID=UPI001C923487|nr:uncharacterized protein LOC122371557 [Amphibalanus amphitrite]